MSDSDEEILKEKDVDPNLKPDRGGGWRDLTRYMFRTFGIAYLLSGLAIFVWNFPSGPNVLNDGSESAITYIQHFMLVIIVLWFGTFGGQYSALVYSTGYMFWQFFGIILLSIILIVAGHRYRKIWWGKTLGVTGVCLWLLVGIYVMGQGA